MTTLKDVAAAAVARSFRSAVARASKFRNVPTVVDGITFASKWEAHRWRELVLEARVGTIRNLERQRPFAIVISERHVCDYVADFVYDRWTETAAGGSWQRVVEDAKGVRTETYRLKRKLMRAVLGIEIVEVRRSRAHDKEE